MMSVGEKGTRYAFKGKPGKNTFFLLSFKVPATSKHKHEKHNTLIRTY
jgi:hypothetical protein